MSTRRNSNFTGTIMRSCVERGRSTHRRELLKSLDHTRWEKHSLPPLLGSFHTEQ